MHLVRNIAVSADWPKVLVLHCMKNGVRFKTEMSTKPKITEVYNFRAKILEKYMSRDDCWN